MAKIVVAGQAAGDIINSGEFIAGGQIHLPGKVLLPEQLGGKKVSLGQVGRLIIRQGNINRYEFELVADVQRQGFRIKKIDCL